VFALRLAIRRGVARALLFGGVQTSRIQGAQAKNGGDSMNPKQTNFLNMLDKNEPEEVLNIIDRPMYRIVVLTVGGQVEDVDIQLTAKGQRYARGRARGFHRRIADDEDALAEILAARDDWQAWQRRSELRPDVAYEKRHFGTT